MTQSEQKNVENNALPSPTGSKMGAEPQALPDDPVALGSNSQPASHEPVMKGLRPSEMMEKLHPDGAAGEVRGDTQKYGDVPTIEDRVKKSPDPERQQ